MPTRPDSTAALPPGSPLPEPDRRDGSPREIRTVCVFCGSNAGHDAAHEGEARKLGRLLAERGLTLIFGGGRVGLMGVLADAVLQAGGTAIGVIPRLLEEIEVGHNGLSTLEVVETMHQRKERMYALSDAFVVLPGGIGTLDETFEILTWRHLRLHDKPIILVDRNGYWQPLVSLLEHVVGQGFARPAVRDYYTIAQDAAGVIQRLGLDGGRE